MIFDTSKFTAKLLLKTPNKLLEPPNLQLKTRLLRLEHLYSMYTNSKCVLK